MKRYYLLALALMIVMSGKLYAEEMKGSDKGSMKEEKGSVMGEMDPAMAQMMAKFQEYSTPGEAHQRLNVLVGSWNHTIEHKMTKDAPVEYLKGTTESEWILDGRFIQNKSTGSWMGMPFHGLGIIGFDNMKKEYTSLWMDNMGTGIMKGSGEFDSADNAIKEDGSYTCPMANGSRKYRSQWKFIDNDNYIYEFYTTEDDGVEFLTMKIDYTRK